MAVGAHLLPRARQDPLGEPVECPIRDALTLTLSFLYQLAAASLLVLRLGLKGCVALISVGTALPTPQMMLAVGLNREELRLIPFTKFFTSKFDIEVEMQKLVVGGESGDSFFLYLTERIDLSSCVHY